MPKHIYIFHYALQHEFWSFIYPRFFNGALSGRLGVFMTTILISLPILGLSLLSYRCIEKPFNDMRGKYLKPRPASGKSETLAFASEHGVVDNLKRESEGASL